MYHFKNNGRILTSHQFKIIYWFQRCWHVHIWSCLYHSMFCMVFIFVSFEILFTFSFLPAMSTLCCINFAFTLWWFLLDLCSVLSTHVSSLLFCHFILGVFAFHLCVFFLRGCGYLINLNSVKCFVTNFICPVFLVSILNEQISIFCCSFPTF